MVERVYQRFLDIEGSEFGSGFVDNGNALLVSERGKERFGKRVLRTIMIVGGVLGGATISGAISIPLTVAAGEKFSSAPAGMIDERTAIAALLIVSTLTLTGMIGGGEVGKMFTERFLGPRNRIKLAAG